MDPSSEAQTPRPLSPHLQVYKPQLTSVLSITHRGTGVALAVGTIVLMYWLLSLAAGPEAYAAASALLGSLLGQLILFAFTLAFFYHLCNGIRHLMWDTGRGLTIEHIRKSAMVVLAAAVVLTILLII